MPQRRAISSVLANAQAHLVDALCAFLAMNGLEPASMGIRLGRPSGDYPLSRGGSSTMAPSEPGTSHQCPSADGFSLVGLGPEPSICAPIGRTGTFPKLSAIASLTRSPLVGWRR